MCSHSDSDQMGMGYVYHTIDQNNCTDDKYVSRRDLRAIVFHILYAIEAYDYSISVDSLVDTLNRGFDLNVALDSEAVTMARLIVNDREILDNAYKPLLANWRFERVSVCTKLILRLAVWELHNTKTDSRIVINEAIELAKSFAEEDSYRFINGLLDKVTKYSDEA